LHGETARSRCDYFCKPGLWAALGELVGIITVACWISSLSSGRPLGQMRGKAQDHDAASTDSRICDDGVFRESLQSRSCSILIPVSLINLSR